MLDLRCLLFAVLNILVTEGFGNPSAVHTTKDLVSSQVCKLASSGGLQIPSLVKRVRSELPYV